ncbi:MAG: ThuA domain-containing protein, partial [Planctomycetota bacterium]|nr:ThuA domain-containing protein [Planctomycetota bacterium]
MAHTKASLLSLLFCLATNAEHLVYEGTAGPGKGKQLVFIAADHEYRSEETLPALARLLARHHGFKCTVLFSVDRRTGEIVPGNSNIPGMDALKAADLMVIFTRFQNLPKEQMQPLVDYLGRGGPVVGLRTSTHGFKIPADSPFAKYSYRYQGDDFKLGFGRQILGETWAGHFGRNHRQSALLDILPEAKDHPILRGVKKPWAQAGAYFARPIKGSRVLATVQPLNGMTIDSPRDEGKKPTPAVWVRTYKSTSGKEGRVFTTTQGASEDILNDDFRRLLANGCFWAVGFEAAIKPDMQVAFVGPYNPTTFRNGGHRRGVKPADMAGWDKPIMSRDALASAKRSGKKPKSKKKKTKGKEDGKNRSTGKPAPPKDAALAQYAIYRKTAPRAQPGEPADTTLPLKLNKGDRIAFIGNMLLERSQHFGHIEALIQQGHPGLQLVFRNLCWPADTPDLQPRPDNFADTEQHLLHVKADVIFAAFGFNESFNGEAGQAKFRQSLSDYIAGLKSKTFNGKTSPRVVLLSPIANENINPSRSAETTKRGVPAADLNNENIKTYSQVVKEVAAAQQVGFVDLFGITASAMASPDNRLTFNGCHLNDAGYRLVAGEIFKQVFGKDAPPTNRTLSAAVVEKNRQYFRRFRPLNTFYYTGGRSGRYGYLDFLPAMRNFEIMTANRDKRIWALASGKKVPAKIDDSNVPPLDETAQARGANKWLSPKDEFAAFKIDPRFEVNLFASEEEFPEIACPIQMRWDARGRMWVSCSTTYPHVYPGQEPNDKIVILEDTNGDGKADKSTVFADDVQVPLSFELGDGGIYVSEEPHLTHLSDTDGDGRADTRRIVLTGFGCEDSHHALHDVVWTPDGDLLFRESIFHNSQVETPYGPVRAKNSAWFSFRPSRQRLVSFGNYPNTNPWGVTFDDWGHHVASHPIFASAFHALNPPYPTQHPGARGIPAYSGVCGQEFVDFDFWPKEMQGGFVKVRYKPTNRVEIHKWVEQDDHFREQYQGDIIFSTNLSFIPVDCRYGPRGAMYVCDWYNPVKGHAQYSLRDPRRDRKSGRLWRIVPKGATLQDPPKIAGETIPALLDILKRREYRYRYWTRRELRRQDPAAVKQALDKWVSSHDKEDPRYRHHQVEAIWAYRNVDASNTDLLREVFGSENHHARAAAAQQLRHWHKEMPDAISLLNKAANDSSGFVRMEAAIAASWIGTKEALDAMLDVFKHPRDKHLAYAITCALGSQNLLRHWKDKPDYAHVSNLLKQGSKKNEFAEPRKNARDGQFDSQQNLKLVRIGCVPERMKYTVEQFAVTTGQPVKILFTNPDATDHNLVVVKPGALEEVGMAANDMAKDPKNANSDFIPKEKRKLILHYSPMIGPTKSAKVHVLRFKAPTVPGIYPYVCTFPGHWIMMKGEMIVASDLKDVKKMLAAKKKPAFSKEWKLADLAADLGNLKGRNLMRGMKSFMSGKCNQCHQVS